MEAMKNAKPREPNVYEEALKNAKPHVAEEDHRYDPPEGYDPKAGPKLPPGIKPRGLMSADEMRADDKKKGYRPAVYDETTKTGSVSDAHWASTQYAQLLMGPVGHEIQIWETAYKPWITIADGVTSTKEDKKKLPKLAKEALQHGTIALKKIDEPLKLLDTRHKAVLGEETVKNARLQVLTARQSIVIGVDRLKRGGAVDPRGEAGIAYDVFNPADPATAKGGWADGAPTQLGRKSPAGKPAGQVVGDTRFELVTSTV